MDNLVSLYETKYINGIFVRIIPIIINKLRDYQISLIDNISRIRYYIALYQYP